MSHFTRSLSWHPGPPFLCLHYLMSNEMAERHTTQAKGGRKKKNGCLGEWTWKSNARLRR